MASINSSKGSGEQREGHSHRNIIHQHYYGPVNNVGHANNSNFGVNHGAIIHNVGISLPSGPSAGPALSEARPQGELVVMAANLPSGQRDLFALLNPILDASHTRNRKIAGPNSACFPGTRTNVLKAIRSWMNSSFVLSNPHIMWIYGYAGCGKSAIAQAVCKHFADQGRLAAAFFFFRGAGDRSSILRFATTVAGQVAAAIPATAPFIESTVRANPGLLSTTTTSLSDQFERLVYQPIDSVKWDRLAVSLRHGPYLIALDGLDECGDHEEIAAFIKHMIAFFEKRPFVPLRFLITSRVENHIHRLLHSSKQVRLLNLVEHTSDADISTALDIIMAEERCGLGLACDQSWPSPEDKLGLVKHIGGSYIFLTTIVKLLFDPYTKDGLTPMERLPLILSIQPDFDGLYRAILEPFQDLPHFQEIISTIALAPEALSIAHIADLLAIKTAKVANVLMNLHAIMQIPGDDRTPVTLWHTSLRDYLCSEDRSGPFYAELAHHRRLAYRCISLALTPPMESSTSGYYSRFALEHYGAFMQTVKGDAPACNRELDAIIDHMQEAVARVNRRQGFTVCFEPPAKPDPDTWTALEVVFLTSALDVVQIELKPSVDVNRPFRDGRTALEIANAASNWELVRALVDVNADVSIPFHDGRTALEVASRATNWELVHALVNSNADVNVQFHDAGDGIVCALHAACHAKQWDLVYLLLDKGANPNIVSPRKDSGGFDDGTALACAAWNKDGKLVARLFACGAEPNLQGGILDTALQAACACKSLATVNLLLDHGADPNLRGGSYGSALHVCARFGYVSLAQALLRHRADPNIQDSEGCTPLRKACCYGHREVVGSLLEFKADASIRDNEGQTALQVARDENEQGIVQLLLRHGIVE